MMVAKQWRHDVGTVRVFVKVAACLASRRTTSITPSPSFLRCSFSTRRRKETQQCRRKGTHMRLRQWIVYCRLTYFVIKTYYRKRSTVQNTSKLLSGVSRCVQRHLLTVRNTNFSVLFIATRLVQFVCQRMELCSNQNILLGLAKWNNIYLLCSAVITIWIFTFFGRHYYVCRTTVSM